VRDTLGVSVIAYHFQLKRTLNINLLIDFPSTQATKRHTKRIWNEQAAGISPSPSETLMASPAGLKLPAGSGVWVGGMTFLLAQLARHAPCCF
jgi:hypothetical protein